MPLQIFQTVMAITTSIMDCLGIRALKYGHVGQLQACANVDILIIQEITFIETLNNFEALSGIKHKHPANPVGFKNRFGLTVVKPARSTNGLFQNAQRGRKSAGVVFMPTGGITILGPATPLPYTLRQSIRILNGLPMRRMSGFSTP